MNFFVPLQKIAQASLGYKSLQNDFFYVNQAVIDTYGIEQDYLQPITLFKEMDGKKYLQNPSQTTWLFSCRKKESDLRGTGALRYIHAMSERPAAEKKQKQSGKANTMREVLEAQSGGLWYTPKAKPHAANLWVRKAFDTVYAPFVFKRARVVDQRCNLIQPKDEPGVSWELLGAVLTSSLFAYSVEINGSVSMGAGALEAPTTKLRGYPVFDVESLSKKEKSELIKLGNAVWKAEKPVDWGADGILPGAKLLALDKWLLVRAGGKLTADEIYADLRSACVARIVVAQDKVRTSTKQKSDNVGSVAKGIAENFDRLMNSRRFPEDFAKSNADNLGVSINLKHLRQIKIQNFFEKAEITFVGEGDKILLEGSYDAAVAEVIVRAVLLGRENFSVPAQQNVAQVVIADFFAWFDKFQSLLNKALDESAVGTGYEESVRNKVYELLKIHPAVGERILPPTIKRLG
jgi:hypothetical protein